MRISDWSSDVCSSDLMVEQSWPGQPGVDTQQSTKAVADQRFASAVDVPARLDPGHHASLQEIKEGRRSTCFQSCCRLACGNAIVRELRRVVTNASRQRSSADADQDSRRYAPTRTGAGNRARRHREGREVVIATWHETHHRARKKEEKARE